uniref:Uncharacterized protein n=1 Tax=Timema tahoe TaxID=61484 RepID=A0A7R9IRU8_9NEOP|nr:unnamed protein product [Timema tahoe]
MSGCTRGGGTGENNVPSLECVPASDFLASGAKAEKDESASLHIPRTDSLVHDSLSIPRSREDVIQIKCTCIGVAGEEENAGLGFDLLFVSKPDFLLINLVRGAVIQLAGMVCELCDVTSKRRGVESGRAVWWSERSVLAHVAPNRAERPPKLSGD